MQDLDGLSVQTATGKRELYRPWLLTIINLFVGYASF